MKKIIIIGSGISGLSAGCYSQMNNYNTNIFEMHNIPGGLCTTWERKGYKIDGCIHWLAGSGPKNNFNNIWHELGILKELEFVNQDEFIRIKDNGNEELIIYTDVDKLETHLLESAPEDKERIKEFTNAIRIFSGFNLPIDKAPELFNLFDKVKIFGKILPFIKILGKYKKKTLNDFASEFKNPSLRNKFHLIFDISEFPLLATIMTLSYLNNKSAGFPIGGSLNFSRTIEKRYLDLGGKICYHSKVNEILTKNNHAYGIKLEDGAEHYADTIISASDGYNTIFNLLNGKYIDSKIISYYEKLPIFPPLIQISLGVNRNFKDEPHSIIFSLDKPIDIAGTIRNQIALRHYCFDPTLCPENKSVLTITFQTNFKFWKNMYSNEEFYKKEKDKIAFTVIDKLENHYKGIKEKIEVVDVSTPMTYERYTGNWQGTYEGWLLTNNTMNLKMKKTLPGLKNFYMIGQWVEPGGGIPPAALSGRNVIQIICRNDSKKFNAVI